ncbi:hypothetical protein N7495_001561 [Penicillium taxi]|uniref:uncharacterized protein n=1 Tax=Penicillium taxi TaxID=168475 RepID=UPI002544FFA4|nr:uncharacterized protein N7495_001561 [Penicillium taxi]KAJ5908879.1 hypothetical protein N7495_001561 [Penicillium taxi]
MHLVSPLLTLSLLSTATATASHLWATHYNGNIYALSFSGSELQLTDTLKTCGDMPSWLTFDSQSRILYCSNENGTADPDSNGSLTAYRAGGQGTLHQVAETATVGGGVHSVIFEGGKGEKFLAIAHYGGSALSTFELPIQDNVQAKQAFHFNMTHEGAVAQQDSPHPHGVYLDPTGSFIVSPDLGADLLRVYAIDQTGQLEECPAVNVTFGNGPRHAVFWTDGTNEDDTRTGLPTHERQVAAVGKTVLYVVNEIGGTMDSFDVAYARSGCLSFQKTQTLVPYPNDTMPDGATPAEIRLLGDTFHVSIRSDQAFAPNDSIVTLDRSPSNGAVTLRDITPSYGKVPRTVAINKAGDLVAIGNQASSTVAIVERDRETGELGDEIAVLKVGETGTVGTSEGLSSVVWDE